MRRFYIENIAAGTSEITIEGQQAVHLKNVLRIKTGSEITLLDGSGSEYIGLVKEFSGQTVIIEILSIKDKTSAAETYISLAFGFLKENKIDDLIRPLTELGVNEIIPFISDRSVSRPTQERIDKKIDRWNKISSESIKQCQRSSKPDISFFNGLEETAKYSKKYEKKIIFYEKNNKSFLIQDHVSSGHIKPKSIIALIGPEGGFTEKEVSMALDNGFESYSLGSGILRAETAIISAAAIIQYLYRSPDIKQCE